MNRLFRHITFLTLTIVVMAACGGGGSDAPTPVPAPTPTPTPDPTPTPEPTPLPAEPQAVAIGFRADLSDAVATTRSVGDGVLDDEDLQAKGFGVYCWYTGTADFTAPKASTNMLMRNQKVEYVSSQWTYSPSKYWPLDPAEKLTFRAYAPYTDYLKEDANGMPQLPVVVKATDYAEGSQHDPLFGTGRLVQTTGDDAGEYFPLPENPTAEALQEYYRFGTLYNDITYKMSGSWRDKPTDHTPADTRDGTIDWYFHHGMAMLVFSAKLEENASGTAEIVSITIGPLYNQGLLSINSPAASNSDEPSWDQKDGNMTVTLYGNDDTHTQDLATYTIGKDALTRLTSPGLLVIPRAYNSTTQLTITVSYKSNGQVNTVTTKLPNEALTGFSGFLGNKIYTLNLTVGNALVAEIEAVNVATSSWNEKEGKEHEVYNW